MSKSRNSGKAMENAKTASPVDAAAANPSLASEIHATTAINSSVRPEDYPEADRGNQVAAAAGGKSKIKGRTGV